MPGHDAGAVAAEGTRSAGEQAGAIAGRPAPAAGALARYLAFLECVLAVVLGLLVLAVHDVRYILRHSYWVDEAWVAASTRYPLSAIRETTSSTPIGFTFLVRLVTDPGTQSARLLPLAFAGAAVVVAYWFGRGLGWQQKWAAVTAAFLAAVGVLLVPGMLVRDDLKQYTAEAFTALLTLALLSRLERDWSWRWLAALSVSAWGGMFLSDAILFVGSAAFAAVCVVQLLNRGWRRFWQAAGFGAATAVLMLVVYKVFDEAAQHQLNSSSYWAGYYLPLKRGLHASVHFLATVFDGVRVYFGLGPAWLVFLLLIAGLVTIAWQRRPATALAIAAVWVENLAASGLQKYPFLNLRTSTFLFAMTAAVAAVGVVGICLALRPWLRAGVAVLAAAALAGFVWGAMPYVRSHTIPTEDIRQQTEYVERHAAPDDVIAVNLNSNWGFAYYWRDGTPARRPDSAVEQDYVAYFPDQPRILIAQQRTLQGVENLLSAALSAARQRGCARIWLVRTHVIASEQAAWTQALSRAKLRPVYVGRDGLSYVQPGGAACS